MNEKDLLTALDTLAAAIASLSRSIVAVRNGEPGTAREQVEVCVALLADYQLLHQKLRASLNVVTS